jgi:hypothetical protein
MVVKLKTCFDWLRMTWINGWLKLMKILFGLQNVWSLENNSQYWIIVQKHNMAEVLNP